MRPREFPLNVEYGLSPDQHVLTSKRAPLIGGFTLAELLVVIAIVAVLVALLLPAIQAAREAARRTSCSDNLRQLGVALSSYHAQQESYPYGGWGHDWVGVPGRSKQNQPGSWAYGILPQLEQESLYELGFDATDSAAFTRRLETPLPVFACPSRRIAYAGPVVDAHVASPKPSGMPTAVARGDYAINGGASNIRSHAGPKDLAEGDSPEYWELELGNDAGHFDSFSGISHLRVGVSSRSIADGMSQTYLLGEKYLAVADYFTGASRGDNETLYSGYCTDLHRFAGNLNALPDNLFLEPTSDSITPLSGLPGFIRFGSAHPTQFGMVFCDGSVHWISFGIDPQIHLRQGHRADSGATLESLRLGL